MQEAVAEILRYVPQTAVPDRARFRALMAKITVNVLRDQHAFFHAKRRAASREAHLDTAAGGLDQLGRSQTLPDAKARKSEESGWVRMAMELLDQVDREVLVLRQWEQRSFPEIAEQLGLTESGARMRCTRALGKLAAKGKALRDGTWTE